MIGFQASGLQNCNTINFSGFKPPNLGYFVMAAHILYTNDCLVFYSLSKKDVPLCYWRYSNTSKETTQW